MIVVSDTSALWTLAAVGRAELLRELYGRVLVPPAVAAEFNLPRGLPVGKVRLVLPGFIEVVPVADQDQVRELAEELDLGESEAIALAVELKADLLLLDEREGRLVAQRRGLPFTGAVGVLMQAKQRGLLPAIRPVLETARQDFGFFLGEELLQRVLTDAGEI